MTAPAPGTSSKLLITGAVSAGAGLLIMLILPLTYGEYSYDSEPWQSKKFGTAVVSLLGGLTQLALILGAVAIVLAIVLRGFEPRVPRPVAPQGYPQGQYGQYPQPQPGQYPQGQTGQYAAQPPAQPDQSGYQQPQPGQPGQPDQGGYQQPQWGGSGS